MSSQPSLLQKADDTQVLLPPNEEQVQVVRDRSVFGLGKYWAYFKNNTKELIGGPGAGGGIQKYGQVFATEPQVRAPNEALLLAGVQNTNGVSVLEGSAIQVDTAGIYQLNWVINITNQPN